MYKPTESFASVFALLARRKNIVSVCPFKHAQCNDVRPSCTNNFSNALLTLSAHTFDDASIFAPVVSKYETISVWSLKHATCSGVRPSYKEHITPCHINITRILTISFASKHAECSHNQLTVSR